MLIDGRPVHFGGPGDAIAAGIGMVHQHFMLIPVFTVAENIALGHEEIKGGPVGFLDRRRIRRDVEEVSSRYGLAVPPDALVQDLPVGVQQRVEILKALMRDASVLILDEPTAVLTPPEIDDLVQVMRRLRDAGTSIVFITHKLKEVRAIADRITVIRRGKVVGEATASMSEGGAGLDDGRSPGAADDRQAALGAGGGRAGRRRTCSYVDPAGVLQVDGVSLSRAGRRDRRPRRRPGQRADRADEVPARPRAGRRGSDPAQRARRHPAVSGRPAGARRRLRARGPDARRARRQLHRRREPRARPATTGRRSVAACGSTWRRSTRTPTSRIEEFDVRTQSIDSPGVHPVRRQPAEGRPRPRAVPPARPAGRRAADPRARRRVDGVRPPAHRARSATRAARSCSISTELEEMLGLADRIVVMYRGKVIGELPAGRPRPSRSACSMAGSTAGLTDGGVAASGSGAA